MSMSMDNKTNWPECQCHECAVAAMAALADAKNKMELALRDARKELTATVGQYRAACEHRDSLVKKMEEARDEKAKVSTITMTAAELAEVIRAAAGGNSITIFADDAGRFFHEGDNS